MYVVNKNVYNYTSSTGYLATDFCGQNLEADGVMVLASVGDIAECADIT